MSELKPCPFCGRQPYESGGYVSCHTELCLANADYHEPAIGPITDWNTRPIEDALNARIAELEAAQKEALLLLPVLERGHYYCDDCWYSCPKAVDGCCDGSQGDECNCGADNYNALLAKIIGLLTSEVQVQEPDVQELRDNWRVLIAEWKASKDGGGE